MNILQAMDDDRLFKAWFDGPEWGAWRAFLAALFALPMTDEQAELFRQCTGRLTGPSAAFNEAWLVVGRRGGKSLIMALIAVYLACFKKYTKHLARGEVATIALIASDRRQARTLARYISGFLEVPALAKLVTRQTTESFELVGRVCIEIHTANFRSIRGYTLAAAVCDEIAFWMTSDNSATPDHEIIAALRPALASIPGAMMICASSPHSKRGELYRAYRRYHGDDKADVLTWQADTATMNRTIPDSVIKQAYERDPDRAKAEFGGEFRDDISGFVAREIVEQCVTPGVTERGRLDRTRYFAFCDPSGGSSDSMTLAIAHHEKGRVILDAIREAKPPFSPEAVCKQFAGVLRDYGITSIQGDRYAGVWPREQFQKCGIEYKPTARPKNELYIALLPKLNSQQIDLLDHPGMINQLCNLERRAAPSGREVIDHGPNQHDDVINCVAGVAEMTARPAFDTPIKVEWAI